MREGTLASGLARGHERLLAIVADNPGWVAFSGGVDSSLVLKVASEVNSFPIVALFADSPLQSEFDRDNVKRLADQMGVQLLVVPFDPLAWPDFVANPDNRCYLCKKAIFGQFMNLLPAGVGVLLDGTNHDDLGADRPGYQAIVELGVVSPLLLASLTKLEVRQLSKWLGLPNWNRPSASCLATRIPGGTTIARELLRYIEDCESVVRRQGFGHIRVRLVTKQPGDLIVELAREEMAREDFSFRRGKLADALRDRVKGKIIFRGRDGVFLC